MNSEQAEIIRTPLGGFVNHSEEPNCKLIGGSKLYLVPLRNIEQGEELTVYYKIDQ